MFILNQMIGTVLVHPDWDATIQWSVKFITFGLVVAMFSFMDDISLAVTAFEGYAC